MNYKEVCHQSVHEKFHSLIKGYHPESLQIASAIGNRSIIKYLYGADDYGCIKYIGIAITSIRTICYLINRRRICTSF